MREAKQEFEKVLQLTKFNPLTIPVISNVHARPYQPAGLKQTLADQINHSVKWTESIRYLMGIKEMEFEEIGPGKVLTGLIQRIKKEAEPLVVFQEESQISGENESLVPGVSSRESQTIPANHQQQASPVEILNAPDGKVASPVKVSSFGKKVANVLGEVQEKAKSLVATGSEKSKAENSKTAATTKLKSGPKLIKPESSEPPGKKAKNYPGGFPAITASSLGSTEFRKDYNLKYAYWQGDVLGYLIPGNGDQSRKGRNDGFFGDERVGNCPGLKRISVISSANLNPGSHME